MVFGSGLGSAGLTTNHNQQTDWVINCMMVGAQQSCATSFYKTCYINDKEQYFLTLCFDCSSYLHTSIRIRDRQPLSAFSDPCTLCISFREDGKWVKLHVLFVCFVYLLEFNNEKKREWGRESRIETFNPMAMKRIRTFFTLVPESFLYLCG